MTLKGKDAAVSLLLLALFVLGCRYSGGTNTNATNSPAATTNTNATKTGTANTTTPPTAKVAPDGIIASGTGVEKEKPAAGKGNVQGKVFYNQQPAPGVEVKLCTKFNQFFGGCGGETFTTKTDDAGEYLIKNVPPGIYEGLIVKIFNTPFYVFATSGIVQSAKYKIEDGQTFFAPDTNLFKSDLKLLSPKAGAKLDANGIEVKWAPYPDAAYYKLSIYADTSSGAEPNYDYIGRRVDGESFSLDKPLKAGAYNARVEAYNTGDIKLAQSANDIKFTVTGGATP